jgi:hypothetical protein
MNSDKDKQARSRYGVISALRLCGAVMLAVGLAIIANNFMGLPIEMGYVLFAVGVFSFIVMPVLLSRRWRTPEQ